MSVPEAVEWSWIDPREAVGRGRVDNSHIHLGYPVGTMLFLDGGTLDLGIVRDSVLNATNDFQIFGETFQHVANTSDGKCIGTVTTMHDGT